MACVGAIVAMAGMSRLACEGALEKFAQHEIDTLGHVDVDIARLRLLPYYRFRCKSDSWDEVEERLEQRKRDLAGTK